MEIGTSLDISCSIVDTLLPRKTDLSKGSPLVLLGIGLIRARTVLLLL
jgi:hypothetical protein